MTDSMDNGGARPQPDDLRKDCRDGDGRSGDSERQARIERLKFEIRAGTYQADIRDIALQLAKALDREQ